ncbi:MAG: repressor LexA [Thiobacillus sp. 63-78]|uniref:transcriptional repressor LexA n=1 Tax=Thiobacillus sp. 63-78 TaxID=1895859 RepID=UPI0009635D06|nr:transcriptional repressor LexA [Thiobacillus sp. 63-78]MBN8774825.1 repressor LexA [Thiobacillus sp.]OJZ16621.1 MAG: repressor LexA [Thiobacillus sp. 63-78]
MRDLTRRQEEIFKLIREWIETTGLPPTRAEIAQRFGFSSPNAAEQHLKALAKKGVLELVPGASRGIRLADGGGLPLVGQVAAGSPILAQENIERHYQLDAALFSPRADYLLKVRGMSMKDAGILDGDLLAVHRSAEARAGQVVVARIGDEVTVKRFQKRGHTVRLLPENPDFEPIAVDLARQDFAIEGIAVGVIRNGNGW